MNSHSTRMWHATMFVSCMMLIAFSLAAQRSFKFETQLVDKQGQPIPFKEGVFKVSILEESREGTPSYVELHHRQTDECGTITLEIGNGHAVWGSLDEVDWSDKCFLVIEHGISESGPFKLMGVSEISAVPVALYAGSAGNTATNADCSPFGVCVLSWGAVGDGVADDTKPFIKAIDFATTHGYRVLVPAGIYRITKTLVVPAGVMIIGEGPGSDPLGTPFDGSLIRYEGQGPAFKIIGSQAGLREIAIVDANLGSLESDGVVIEADSRLVESVRLDRLLITNFIGGTALRLEAKNSGGVYYTSCYDLRIRHALIGIHIVQDNTSAVNSNSFYHGAISGGGFHYGILVDGGNNNLFEGMIIEPPTSTHGHLVVNKGEIQGNDIRIEGTMQSTQTPLVFFRAGTSHSTLKGTYGGGLTIDQGANFLDFRSIKNMDPAPQTDNLLQNASFYGFSNNILPYWEITGSGVSVSVLPPELSPTHNVLKLTVPAGIVSNLKPNALFMPQLMNLPEYQWVNFGMYVRTTAVGTVYTRYNAASGVVKSIEHPGDGKWHFIGMSAPADATPDPRLEISNITNSDIEVYISMPTFNFGQSLPTPQARPITTAGGILTGTLSQGVVELAPSGPYIVLPKEGNIFIINGTPTITRINYALPDRFPKGAVIVLVFNDSGANITNNPYIVLKSGFTSTVNATLTLLSNGNGTWREIGRNL